MNRLAIALVAAAMSFGTATAQTPTVSPTTTPATGDAYERKADSLRAVAAVLNQAAKAADEFGEEQDEFRSEVIDAQEERRKAISEYEGDRAKDLRKNASRTADVEESIEERNAKVDKLRAKRDKKLAEAFEDYRERSAEARAEFDEDAGEEVTARENLELKRQSLEVQRRQKMAGTDAERLAIESEYRREIAKASEERASESRTAVEKVVREVDKQDAKLRND